MPTSTHKKINRVMAVFHHIDPPKSVLDIGVGFGKYGFLMREYLDIRKRRYEKARWEAQIDGIESYAAYITPMHRYLYNNLMIGDVCEMVGTLPAYDLVIMADVIEHMDKPTGMRILRELYKNTNGAIVVSYPKIIGTEHVHWDNPKEQHHCVWTPEDFDGFPKVVMNGTQVAYILKEA